MEVPRAEPRRVTMGPSTTSVQSSAPIPVAAAAAAAAAAPLPPPVLWPVPEPPVLLPAPEPLEPRRGTTSALLLLVLVGLRWVGGQFVLLFVECSLSLSDENDNSPWRNRRACSRRVDDGNRADASRCKVRNDFCVDGAARLLDMDGGGVGRTMNVVAGSLADAVVVGCPSDAAALAVVIVVGLSSESVK
jgi:hypothetical protein